MHAAKKFDTYRRKSKRYEVTASVCVSENSRRAAFGTLFDISRDGVGFHADPQLRVGHTYLLNIDGIGSMRCEIVHNSNFNRYGGVLKISESRKQELEALIIEMSARTSWRRGRVLRMRPNL